MILKDMRGKVPIKNSTQNEATPYLLLNFPTRPIFDLLYAKHRSCALKDQYWAVLNHRNRGNSLEDCGRLCDLSRERVRQIEARFIKLLENHYTTENEANLFTLCVNQKLVESFLNSETP